MRKFDKQEEKILRELVRNPRISDNQIAKNTMIPVTTVNRKRKLLEEEGYIHYYSNVSYESYERGQHNARQLYIVKFKEGITRQKYLDEIKKSENFRKVNPRHHAESFLGEKDGHFAIILILEAGSEDELIEIFNGAIIPEIKKRHGRDCINEIITAKVTFPFRVHHNYLPLFNMDRGTIKKDWLNEWVFVPNTENKTF
ncbi:winged helix-turn-helix domain-containing protein [Candidatus Woesearchaeota archaeon]|nr:winged helix-turn-helix domain-containing protein [Candidatus Woesearchaeota archaeon]